MCNEFQPKGSLKALGDNQRSRNPNLFSFQIIVQLLTLTYLILQKKNIYIYMYIYIERENDTWARVDMEFLLECLTR